MKEKMNVSAICQGAIETAVKTEEIKMSAMSQREAAIARLKIEAKKEDEDWEEKGKRHGLEIAPSLSYADFRQVQEWDEFQQSPDGWQVSLLDAVMSDENWSSVIEAAKNAKCPQVLMESYVQGVIDGVLEFWDSIESEL